MMSHDLALLLLNNPNKQVEIEAENGDDVVIKLIYALGESVVLVGHDDVECIHENAKILLIE